MALRRHWDQGQNDKLETHTAGLELQFNKGIYQAHWKPGGTGRLSVKRIQMTVNPFLVLVPRDWGGTDFVSKREIYPCEALAGSQSSPDSSENITVYTEGWSSNVLLNVISLEIAYETSQIGETYKWGVGKFHLIILLVPKAAWQSRAPLLPSQREMYSLDGRQMTGKQTSEETGGE